MKGCVQMKEFKDAEIEIILLQDLDEDILTTSGGFMGGIEEL